MKQFFISKSKRLRSTPYSERIESQGASAYTVYNHMLLPTVFASPEEDYHHLKQHVQVWDVSGERQVQIRGKDAAKLTQMMTCRSLRAATVGKCYYCPLVDENGGMVNDPLIMKLADDRWWISIADSDVMLYAKGLAAGFGLEVSIDEPDVNILAVQGPKSSALMERIFGAEVGTLKFFGFAHFDFGGARFLIARSGWSKQGGFEIYVDNDEAGLRLYDALFAAGQDLQIRPGCPNLIERIESGLLSYGNDMEIGDTPFHCGLDKYVATDNDTQYLAKKKLLQIMTAGVSRKLRGVMLDMEKIAVEREIALCSSAGESIGGLRSAAYSPLFKCVIGIAMINRGHWQSNTMIEICQQEKNFPGVVCDFPFI